MNNTERNNEIVYFAESAIRELYNIPASEGVAVSVVHINNMPFLKVISQYLTEKPMKVCISGLMKQLEGVESLSYYLRIKTKFIKTIIKNSIHIKDEPSKYIINQLEMFVRNRNRSWAKTETTRVKNKAEKMMSSIHSISSIYALDVSVLPVQLYLADTVNTIKAVSGGDSVSKAIHGDFSEISCELSKGIFTISYMGHPVYDKDIMDGSENYLYNISDNVMELYKNFREFFEEKTWESSKDSITKIVESQRRWGKNKSIYKMFCDISAKYLCTANEDGTDYFIDNVSIASKDIEKIYRSNGMDMNDKERNVNVAICNALKKASDLISRTIISLFPNENGYTEDEIFNILSRKVPAPTKRTLNYLAELEVVSDSELREVLNCLTENGFLIKLEDSRYICPNTICEKLFRIYQMDLSAKEYVKKYCLPLQEEKEVEKCEVNENHRCAGKAICPLCGGHVIREKVMVPRPELKISSDLNIFQTYELLSLDVDSVFFTEREEEGLLSLIEVSSVAIPLKQKVLDFFSKYKNGELESLVQLKYLLYAESEDDSSAIWPLATV